MNSRSSQGLKLPTFHSRGIILSNDLFVADGISLKRVSQPMIIPQDGKL